VSYQLFIRRSYCGGANFGGVGSIHRDIEREEGSHCTRVREAHLHNTSRSYLTAWGWMLVMYRLNPAWTVMCPKLTTPEWHPVCHRAADPWRKPFATDPIWIGLGGILPSNSTSQITVRRCSATRRCRMGCHLSSLMMMSQCYENGYESFVYTKPIRLTLSAQASISGCHHRPRSTSQVPRTTGASSPPPVVIVHFTSLTNYKLVKEVITIRPRITSQAPHLPFLRL